MVEAPGSAGRDAVSYLVEVLVGRLNSGPASDALVARRSLYVLLTGRVAHADRRLVAALRNREITHQEHKAFAMRLLCQIGEPYAIAKCGEIVVDRNALQADRDEAARAICRSGNPAAVDLGISTFATQRGARRHLATALASGEAACQAALVLVRRGDLDQALRVSVAIEQLQANGVETAALELLGDPALGLTGRAPLVVALLRAGHPVDSDEARELVDDPNVTQSDRLQLVHALLLRGEFSALPAAADQVIDIGIDFQRRRALAQTMISVGREGAQALYVSATRQSFPPAARLQAFRALIERRHPEGCRAAAAMVANGEGERGLQAQLLGDLLTHAPQAVNQQAVVGMLSDRDLTDGELHSSWEDLAAEALQAGDVELRESLRGRIKRRVEDVDGRVAELSTVDVGRLLALLADSGPSGLDLLVDIATDVDARIDAAMSAVTTDVGCVDRLEELLDDQGLRSAFRDRLAVAFAMLGARQMLPRVMEMLPASEPAYVALRSVLRSEAITYELMQDGVRSAREALQTLDHGAQVTWYLDFGSLARRFAFESGSHTLRELRLGWITQQLRQRTYARLLSLLLPSERLALYRVGGFVESEATRNWLATWVPAYHDVAAAETTRLQALISADPSLLPDIVIGGPFKVVANVASLLEEWWDHLVERRWRSCVSLMTANQSIFASALPCAVDGLAGQLGRQWPANAARAYLLTTARSDNDDLPQVCKLLLRHTGPLDAARVDFGAAEAGNAFGAASFAIFRSPTMRRASSTPQRRCCCWGSLIRLGS